MTHPNTDSRELEQLIKWLRPPKDYVVDDEKFKQAILAYTANKQRQLLEWVEQELPPRAKDGHPELDDDYEQGRHDGEIYAHNFVVDQMRHKLKNKKESL